MSPIEAAIVLASIALTAVFYSRVATVKKSYGIRQHFYRDSLLIARATFLLTGIVCIWLLVAG